MICAMDENLIKKEKFEEFETQFDMLLRILNGYVAYLKRAKKTQ